MLMVYLSLILLRSFDKLCESMAGWTKNISLSSRSAYVYVICFNRLNYVCEMNDQRIFLWRPIIFSFGGSGNTQLGKTVKLPCFMFGWYYLTKGLFSETLLPFSYNNREIQVTQDMRSDEKPWYRNWPVTVPKHIDYPKGPLFDLLGNTAKIFPEKTALVFLEKEISYDQLDALSDKFAGALASLSVKKGDCVALFLPNVPQFVIAYYGALKAGAILTAISPLYREREVEFQLSDSKAKTVVTLDSLLPVVDAVRHESSVENVIVTDGGWGSEDVDAVRQTQKGNGHSFQHLLEKHRPSDAPNLEIDGSVDLAALQYTGGTTGKAKAAMLTHANLVSNAMAFASWIKGVQGQETFLTALPLFHIYGMTTSLNVPVYLAAKIVLSTRFEPAKLLGTIQRHRVTVFCGVPTMYQALLASPELSKFDLTSIRVCISGASSLPVQVQEKFMEVTGGLLAEGYGLTEASPVTHCSPVDPTLSTVRVGSIGLPLPDTDARIVDLETGTKTMPVGETGELAVHGPQVMKGYWNQPEETALVLRSGWLFTGDIARMDAEGYFYITDRKKDLIKYKDYSVYPREIEEVLYTHPAVKLCSVVGKPDPLVGEIPKAFVVLKDATFASAEELMLHVKGKVAAYKAVREVEFRKDLPLSSAGKVLRRNLRDEERDAVGSQNL